MTRGGLFAGFYNSHVWLCFGHDLHLSFSPAPFLLITPTGVFLKKLERHKGGWMGEQNQKMKLNFSPYFMCNQT